MTQRLAGVDARGRPVWEPTHTVASAKRLPPVAAPDRPRLPWGKIAFSFAVALATGWVIVMSVKLADKAAQLERAGQIRFERR